MAERCTDRSRYPARPAQVKNARRRAERVAREWEVDEDTVEDLVTVVGELVANAVKHAPTRGREVGLTLRLLASVLRVEVRDPSPELPKLRPLADPSDTDSAENGRGLHLIAHLCQDWGSHTEVIGKTVFAELPLIPDGSATGSAR